MSLSIEHKLMLIDLVEKQMKFERQMIDICERALSEKRIDNTSDIQGYIDTCNLKIADLDSILNNLKG